MMPSVVQRSIIPSLSVSKAVELATTQSMDNNGNGNNNNIANNISSLQFPSRIALPIVPAAYKNIDKNFWQKYHENMHYKRPTEIPKSSLPYLKSFNSRFPPNSAPPIISTNPLFSSNDQVLFYLPLI